MGGQTGHAVVGGVAAGLSGLTTVTAVRSPSKLIIKQPKSSSGQQVQLSLGSKPLQVLSYCPSPGTLRPVAVSTTPSSHHPHHQHHHHHRTISDNLHYVRLVTPAAQPVKGNMVTKSLISSGGGAVVSPVIQQQQQQQSHPHHHHHPIVPVSSVCGQSGAQSTPSQVTITLPLQTSMPGVAKPTISHSLSGTPSVQRIILPATTHLALRSSSSSSSSSSASSSSSSSSMSIPVAAVSSSVVNSNINNNNNNNNNNSSSSSLGYAHIRPNLMVASVVGGAGGGGGGGVGGGGGGAITVVGGLANNSPRIAPAPPPPPPPPTQPQQLQPSQQQQQQAVAPSTALAHILPSGGVVVAGGGVGVGVGGMVQSPNVTVAAGSATATILPAGGQPVGGQGYSITTLIAPSSKSPSFTTAQLKQDFIPIASNNPAVTANTLARNVINGTNIEATGARPRKPCNCTKSQCLKLYCDCFANGEFCHNCNCTNCANNLEHEEERSRAIKACLDRNPMAFHPKIGKGKGKDGDGDRRHNKGCNCKRSGCLKNYCECYEAKIMCSSICKCVGCKNFEESMERKTLMHLADAAEVRVQQQTAAKSKLSSQISSLPSRPPTFAATGEKLPYTFVTPDVVEESCVCLLARAEESQKLRLPSVVQERMVIEEFGRCLMRIIESAHKTKVLADASL